MLYLKVNLDLGEAFTLCAGLYDVHGPSLHMLHVGHSTFCGYL